jgi:hypothetical protein
MNERIKELEKQCWDRQTNHLNTEKFARLIVIECKQILLDLMLESISDNGAIDLSLTLINDRFGMEDDEPA